MTNPQNVELEAAKILQKLIQESKDEPSKLATKLYVILQHMRSIGNENSMPYQVVSRAMETIIKEHSLDIETLMSSRLAAGAQIGDSTSQQLAGLFQLVGASTESQSGNEIGAPETYASTRAPTGLGSGGQDMYQGSAAHITGGAVKAHGVSPGAPASYLSAELANRMQFGSSSFDSHGFASKTNKDRSMVVFNAMLSGDHSSGKNIAGKTMDPGGSSATNVNMGSFSSSPPETNMLRTTVSRDVGKSPVSQASGVGLPFKEQQLDQLRAQCFVFLAFRNGSMPMELHLEIALGNIYSKEDGTHPMDQKGKKQLGHDTSSVPELPRSLERPDSSKGLKIHNSTKHPHRITDVFLSAFAYASVLNPEDRTIKYMCTERHQLIPLPHHLRANNHDIQVTAARAPALTPIIIADSSSPDSAHQDSTDHEQEDAPIMSSRPFGSAEILKMRQEVNKGESRRKVGNKRAHEDEFGGGRGTHPRIEDVALALPPPTTSDTAARVPHSQSHALNKDASSSVTPTRPPVSTDMIITSVTDHSYLGWDPIRVERNHPDQHPRRLPEVTAYLCSNTPNNLGVLPNHIRQASENPSRSWTTNLEAAVSQQPIFDNMRLAVLKQGQAMIAMEKAIEQMDETCQEVERTHDRCRAAEQLVEDLRRKLKAAEEKAEADQKRHDEVVTKLKEEMVGLRAQSSSDQLKLEKIMADYQNLQREFDKTQGALMKAQEAAQNVSADQEDMIGPDEAIAQVNFSYICAYADCLRAAHRSWPEDPLTIMKEDFYTFVREHPLPADYKLPIADLAEFGCDFSFLPAEMIEAPMVAPHDENETVGEQVPAVDESAPACN